MRLIHTADWHIGRLLHNVHLTRDQEKVLLQLVELVADVRPHAVLIAGDLYDRAVPPTEAVELLNHVLTEIVLGLHVPVVAIAGNHDSAARLEFGGALLKDQGLHLVGRLPEPGGHLTLHDEHGPVHLHPLPFADAAEARYAYGDPGIHDQEAVLRAGVSRALAGAPAADRHVAVAHAFVAGSSETPESERPLSVGGGGCVSTDAFAGFDYVALGHLHRPQTAGASTVRYAGSLMKYSFAEHDHRKSASVVEVGPREQGEREAGGAEGGSAAAPPAPIKVETVALTPPRDLRRVEGTLDELLRRADDDRHRDDYLLASLLDTGALLDPIGRLREAYPNVLAVERPLLALAGEGGERRPKPGSTTDLELFDSFYRYTVGRAMDDEERTTLAAVLDDLERRRREAVP